MRANTKLSTSTPCHWPSSRVRCRQQLVSNGSRFIPHVTLCLAALLLGIAQAAGCCSPCFLAGRTLIGEPSRYSVRVDRKRSLTLYRTWAEQHWQQEAGSCASDCPLTADYHAGFVTGFVDYVYAGGSGEPSPVPPREYWKVSQSSPQGKQRVNQWFAGYRHGARLAHEGGYREAGTIQLSLAESSENVPWEPTSGETATATTPQEESLPTPKTENQPANRPTPPLRSRPETPPNGITPDNPFREDEPSRTETNTRATPDSKPRVMHGANEASPVKAVPAEIDLPTEPLELTPAKIETSVPLQQHGPGQPLMNGTGDVAESDQTRPSSRNRDVLALVAASDASIPDKISTVDSASRNSETSLVVRLNTATPRVVQHQHTPPDSAPKPAAAIPRGSDRWRPVETTQETSHPGEPTVYIRVTGNGQGEPH